MNPENREALNARVALVAGLAVGERGFVTAIDVLRGLGWLDEATVVSWHEGQLPCLERGVRADLSRVAQAMKLFRKWAAKSGLKPSEAAYRVRGRPRLRFSVSGDPHIERHYRTHWLDHWMWKDLVAERRGKKTWRARRRVEAPPERMALWELGIELEMEALAREHTPARGDEAQRGGRGGDEVVGVDDLDDDWDIPF